MADLSDVLAALVAASTAAVYPGGIGQASVSGTQIKVFPGWPVQQQLDADMGAGICHVSIYPRDEESPTTRYLNDGESVVSISTAKMAAAVAGQTVTLSGVIPAANDPHVVVLMVNGKPYAYQVLVADTLATTATALAALVAVDVAGTVAAGAVITAPAPARITAARVVTSGVYAKELRRQRRLFQVTVWAPTPTLRDQVSGPLDVALADVRFLALPDQKARLLYKGSPMSDGNEKARIYRRDLLYTVEYGTSKLTTVMTVGVDQVNVTPQGQNAALAPIASTTINI